MDIHGAWGTLDPFIEHSGVMGRSVANAGFLKALLKQDPFPEYHFFLAGAGEGKGVRTFLEEQHPTLLDCPGKIRIGTRPDLLRALHTNDYHCFHLSDCINYPPHLARLRNVLAPTLFPVTSVTHSLSYARYSSDFFAHIWPGKTPRDVIVATSETAQNMLQGCFSHLQQAYGLDTMRFTPPAINVVPLGIELGQFMPLGADERLACREGYGIASDSVVLLVFARLSHTAKLDLLPLLHAIRRAAAPPLSSRQFTLLLAGASDAREHSDYLQHVRTLAGNIGLNLQVVTNPDDAERRQLFGSSDIFVSPVDNYQETFGLTLLEAGAMELPVVASDFDGYRHLIDHGKTGFLIPTLASSDTTTIDAAARVLMDNQHHLCSAQQLAVDVSELANKLRELAMAPELRQKMGRAAREKIASTYDWDTIVRDYCTLWEQLWQIQIPTPQEQAIRKEPHPLHLPLSGVFGEYPSRLLEPGVRLRWSRSGEAFYRGKEGLVIYAGLQGLLQPEYIRTACFLARKGVIAGDLASRLAQQHGLAMDVALWCLLWALKHDLLELDT